MRARLKDVAAKAGVAPNTASTILNRKPNSWASEETRERVFKVAEELNYRPSRTALGLRTGSFKAIGLVVPDLHNPFYTAFSDCLERALRKFGYDLILEHSREDMDYQSKCLLSLLDRQIDAVAYFVNDLDKHLDFLAKAKEADKTVVALTGPPPKGAPHLPFDSIQIDFTSGFIEAVDHLIELGHQRFAFLSALSKGQSADGRPEMFNQLLQARGVTEENNIYLTCSHELEDMHRVFKEYLESQPPQRHPTALIALNDLAAIGAMRAAADCGFSVPGDISVVGVDDIPLGCFLPQRLSTIRQPIKDMAEATAMMLLNRLRSSSESSTAVQSKCFNTQFVCRETTSAVSSG
ncbi:LacI family DNA-binding transcriptional regulator [Coraliomargarita sp. SDUM461004]|uniref:LacI family DNA-binding transcriptional regulator n=1 Tax=Thalassobacterium sedimentorum TaxID=3041258 RepID=A0ABU1AMT4_9BACT|nr:LacI family DNA-binding transcriptional regulator [Coraliomargarita sp. SDUM461004]MDQ8196104.1 LacI family DNA-binding transcriptional regulator [Coraliomargarita sp. SDUM461004]